MNICYLVGAGDFFGMPSPDPTDLVIAADGGYDSLISHGVRCDLLIGDLDSISERPNGVELLLHPKEKDETDMYLAYLEGVRRGYSHFEVYGGTGGREDHTLANYALLLYAARRGAIMRMHGERSVATVTVGTPVTLKGKPGETFSVFAFGGDASGVTISGAKYEVGGVELKAEFPLGVSNELASDAVSISHTGGALLIIAPRCDE